MWFDGATTSMVEASAIQNELLDLRADLSVALAGRDPASLAPETCSSQLLLRPLRERRLEGMQQLLDKFVVMAILAGDHQLEYYILPYLLGEPSPARLVIHGSCACGSQPAESADQTQRIQAYAYAALALYEIRRQESHREACGARRAEILVQRAISKVSDLDAHSLPEDLPDRALVVHLRDRCLLLERIIDELGTASTTCGMPAESPRLAHHVAAADVCGTK
jgi:hypothetical protein